MICGMTYFQICLYFLIYSFGGWVVEVIFHAVALGKVINRGFLNGPVCPVYGFGVLSVFALLNTIQGSGHQMSDGMIFVFGIVLATAVELVAGWLLDVCFHARWWDYSDKPLIFMLHLPGVFSDLGTGYRYGSKSFPEVCRGTCVTYTCNLGMDCDSSFVCCVSDRFYCDGSSDPGTE